MTNNIQRVFEDINNLTEEEKIQLLTKVGKDRINTLILIMRKVRSHRV